MLFSEIYGAYFDTVETILHEAADGTLTRSRMTAIIRDKAFAESGTVIPNKLMSEEWPLLTKDFETPVIHNASKPTTILQKRWLKALLQDPRIQLFQVDDTGLEDIEPLFTPDRFYCFDQYSDGDPFGDPHYIRCFRSLLQAIHSYSAVETEYELRSGRIEKSTVYPFRLEYSSIDDKFRLIATNTEHQPRSMNLARIRAVRVIAVVPKAEWKQPHFPTKRMSFELTDDRFALERVMHQFSYLTKETVRTDDKHYMVTMTYHSEDENEIVIKLLSFGAVIKVISPNDLIEKMKDRILRQIQYSQTQQ